MPTFAGVGRLLRGVNGYPGSALTADSVPLFNFGQGDGTAFGPALVGTRFFNAAAQLTPGFIPGFGMTVAPGTYFTPNYVSLQPQLAWGRRGTVPRVPQTVVLVMPSLTTDPPLNDAMQFARELADRVADAGLPARGVQVLMTCPSSRHMAVRFPLLGPTYLTGAVLADAEDVDIHFGGRQRVTAATDVLAAVGGDVWWGFVGALNADFGEYTLSGEAPSTAPDVYDFDPSGALTEMYTYSDPVPDGAPRGNRGVFGWNEMFDAHAGHALAVAGRCRRFRFAWVWPPGEFFGVGPSSDPAAFLGRLPPGLGAAAFNNGSGAAAADAILDDVRGLFGL